MRRYGQMFLLLTVTLLKVLLSFDNIILRIKIDRYRTVTNRTDENWALEDRALAHVGSFSPTTNIFSLKQKSITIDSQKKKKKI